MCGFRGRSIGLDECVVDALGFQSGEEEVPELVGADVVLEAGFVCVAGENGTDSAGAVGLAPGGFE